MQTTSRSQNPRSKTFASLHLCIYCLIHIYCVIHLPLECLNVINISLLPFDLEYLVLYGVASRRVLLLTCFLCTSCLIQMQISGSFSSGSMDCLLLFVRYLQHIILYGCWTFICCSLWFLFLLNTSHVYFIKYAVVFSVYLCFIHDPSYPCALFH